LENPGFFVISFGQNDISQRWTLFGDLKYGLLNGDNRLRFGERIIWYIYAMEKEYDL